MTFRILLAAALALFLFACTDGSAYAPEAETASVDQYDDYQTLETSVEPPRTAEPLPPPDAPQPTVRPRIIYTAAARARVENLDSALVIVNRRITAAGGYVSSQHRTNSNHEHTATLTIRLPAERLSPTLALLPELAAEIDYQNLDSRDVTAEWVDLESRLQTKREVRDRYIDILRNRARKVEDILAAEDKIRVITEEIEAKEGRLRYLRDQVSLSTLTLELYETREYRPVGPVTKRTFGSELVAALANGWVMVRELFLGVLSVWPLWILLGLGVWLFRRYRRRV